MNISSVYDSVMSMFFVLVYIHILKGFNQTREYGCAQVDPEIFTMTLSNSN